jgi:hypothetical protein
MNISCHLINNSFDFLANNLTFSFAFNVTSVSIRLALGQGNIIFQLINILIFKTEQISPGIK